MKNLNQNQKISIIALAIFAIFLIGFFISSKFVQCGLIPDFTPSQKNQSVFAFAMGLPLCVAMFFGGKHLKYISSKIGDILIFVSLGLTVFSVLQVFLSLFGVYN